VRDGLLRKVYADARATAELGQMLGVRLTTLDYTTMKATLHAQAMQNKRSNTAFGRITEQYQQGLQQLEQARAQEQSKLEAEMMSGAHGILLDNSAISNARSHINAETPAQQMSKSDTSSKNKRVITPKECQAKPEEISAFTAEIAQYGITDVAGFERYKGESYVLDGLAEAVSKLSVDFAHDVGKIKLRYGYLGNQGTFGCYNPSDATITLNSYYFDASEFLEAEYNSLVESGHFPEGTDFKSVLIHEFGHQVAVQHNIPLSAIIKKAYKAISEDYPNSKKIDILLIKYVSRYATSEVSGKFTETIAEIFSAYYNGINNVFCSAYIEYILDYLK